MIGIGHPGLRTWNHIHFTVATLKFPLNAATKQEIAYTAPLCFLWIDTLKMHVLLMPHGCLDQLHGELELS